MDEYLLGFEGAFFPRKIPILPIITIITFFYIYLLYFTLKYSKYTYCKFANNFHQQNLWFQSGLDYVGSELHYHNLTLFTAFYLTHLTLDGACTVC